MMELMIAMVLSSIVIYGAISMFMASRGTSQTTSAVGNITDTGRVALDMMSETARSSGSMACSAVNDQSPAYATDLNAGGTPLQLSYQFALDGFEAVGSAPGNALVLAAMPVAADGAANDWAGTAGSLDGLLIGRVIKNSDVVAMREAIPESAPVYTVAAYTAGNTTISVNSVGDLQAGEYATISSCTSSTTFQIGAVNSAANTITTNGPLTLNAGNLEQNFSAAALIAPVDMAVYYIGAGRDGDSSLFKYDEWTGKFQELVPDVENMQVLYGVETSAGSGQISEYVTADQVPNFNSIANIKIGLLVASPPGAVAVAQPAAAPTFKVLGTTVKAPLDQRLRKVFETTIAVQNAAL
jgi:type IV pilus assembly protein PilW